MNKNTMIAGEYYRINGTKKVLYWNGEIWCKPKKDNQGKFGSWVTPMAEQPKNVKYVELVNIYKI